MTNIHLQEVNDKYGQRMENMTVKYQKRKKLTRQIAVVEGIFGALSILIVIALLLFGTSGKLIACFSILSVLFIAAALTEILVVQKKNTDMLNRLRKEYLPKLYPDFRYDFSLAPKFIVEKLQHNDVDIRENPWFGLTVLPEGKLRYFVSGLTSKELGLRFYECSIRSSIRDSSGLFDSENYEGVVGIISNYDDVLLATLRQKNLWRFVRIYEGKLVILLEGMSFDFIWELMNGDPYTKLQETLRGNQSVIYQFIEIVMKHKKLTEAKKAVFG